MDLVRNQKIDVSTLRQFIDENRDRLYFNSLAYFEDSDDSCIRPEKHCFKKVDAETVDPYGKVTLNIHGLWLVGSTGDNLFYYGYRGSEYVGITLKNHACKCIIAVKQEREQV